MLNLLKCMTMPLEYAVITWLGIPLQEFLLALWSACDSAEVLRNPCSSSTWLSVMSFPLDHFAWICCWIWRPIKHSYIIVISVRFDSSRSGDGCQKNADDIAPQFTQWVLKVLTVPLGLSLLFPLTLRHQASLIMQNVSFI